MTDKDIHALAAKIAADLFTNGCAERAQRLVMMIDKPVERNLGGWSERGCADRIAKLLTSVRATTTEGKK